MSKLIARFSLLLLSCIALSSLAFGQSGAIQGALIDANGGAITNGKVTLIDSAARTR